MFLLNSHISMGASITLFDATVFIYFCLFPILCCAFFSILGTEGLKDEQSCWNKWTDDGIDECIPLPTSKA